MSRNFNRALLPAAIAAVPLGVEALRACTTGASIWFWGDQALIDIEARNSLLGRNLLGVYDRYGWHHLGPLWLLVLGIFRWVAGGSAKGLVLGSYAIEAAAAAAIVIVASRLRSGLVAWWAALVVIGYEWSFGLERLGTVWAPYAVALPAALMVLLVADVVASEHPWPPTIAAAACASLLCQTEISTLVMVVALVLGAPLLRLAVRTPGRAAPAGRGTPAILWAVLKRLGWSSGRWWLGAAGLVALLLAAWLPPVVQQLTTSPGNLVAVFRFFATHAGHHTWQVSLKAADTVFGSFPFRTGVRSGNHDADPAWLVATPLWQRPWYLFYIVVNVGAAIVGLARKCRSAFAVAAATALAMLAAASSLPLIYGPIYPYLVFWMGALVVPTWVAVWLALAPPVPSTSRGRRSVLAGLGVPAGLAGAGLPLVSLVAATTVSSAFAVSPVPMTGGSSRLGREAWTAVSTAASSPRVKTVYVNFAGLGGMPDAAAIADQAVRHGLHVEVNHAALRFLDPTFAASPDPQLEVTVCCGVKDHRRPPRGLEWRARVGGQNIYISVPR